ncbi:hypothetical protein NAL32_16505 [Chryseobacterium sp. Ch-15]|uniref:Uncharacterized protein n=1 Tax=Chryseobacterium muglaense TaxID=2893752 RepID=A0A9Q3UZD0_9FLAO|nr:hypothetical protein [Chryseobacterium muglaense]MBD3906221.1 hypothetical protein [Chryseobacterium muglaense]MCC9036806.1 hypothetical protein [Chryseobacterium muglaense]MCM2555987.1 hypothetical protein [Chryseobacterium muglaense]
MVILLATTITGCKKNYPVDEKKENQLFQFTEIGSKELITTKFPSQWRIHPYESSFPISESDRINESNLNKLDYFDNVKGRLVKNRNYISFIKEKGIRLDSTFVVDSISNKNRLFVYLKTFKTIEDPSYDFPPTVNQIDILIFENSQFSQKLNVYTKKSYPFAIDLKLGYFNKDGNLFTKEFKTDEENTIFTKEEHFKLSNSGIITKQNSTIINENKGSIAKHKILKESDLIGAYKIYAPAISNSNGEEISLGYFITIKSPTKAVLSIDAKYSEDYGCEGEYRLTNNEKIIYAKGKCDQDNLDNFYIKYENEKYFIKSKRFLNQDWQELIKE